MILPVALALGGTLELLGEFKKLNPLLNITLLT